MWFNGKLVVLDITETGRQIGEKLAVLLSAEQQINLTQYLLYANGKGTDTDSFLRKFSKTLDASLTEIREGDLYLCLEQRLVIVREQEICLTVKEFEILFLLASNPNRVLTYELIMDLVWHEDYAYYDVWAKQEKLMTTEGNVIYYGFIENFIDELGKKFHIKEIAFDRWGAVQMVQNMEGLGFTVIPFGQGFKDMSPPSKELMKLTLEQRIAHGGHPVLRWMMDNIFVRTDPAGNIKPDKEKSTEKIDGAVATIMALDRAIRNGGSMGSVYDDRGILVF